MTKKLIIANMLNFIPDRIFNKFLFKLKLGYWPNFTNPKSFNEKINYIKLHSNNSLRKLVADRIKVREYIKKTTPECSLIAILWKGNEFTKEIYNQLPKNFVIKANHGSGMVIVVDKERISFNEIYRETEKWKKIDYGIITRQFVYNDIPKTLIVEEFINFDSKVVPDYKFMCIKGKVEFIQVDLDRFDNHSRNIYDYNFNKTNITLEYLSGQDIKKPMLFENAKDIAEKLSKDFDFIRVDLYILEDIIYFGELTNTPGNGFELFTPINYDFELGDKIELKKEFTNDI